MGVAPWIISEVAGSSFAGSGGVICRCRTWHQGDTIKLPWTHVFVCVPQVVCGVWCRPPKLQINKEILLDVSYFQVLYPVFTPQLRHRHD